MTRSGTQLQSNERTDIERWVQNILASEVWGAERFPSSSIALPGGASDATRESTTGLITFPDAATKLIYVLCVLPPSWVPGSELHPIIRWSKTTSATGAVKWQLRYDLAKPGGTFAGAFATLGTSTSATGNTTDASTAWQHLLSYPAALPMTGLGTYPGATILFELSRIGADAADTYAASARLLSLDVHFRRRVGLAGTLSEYEYKQ